MGNGNSKSDFLALKIDHTDRLLNKSETNSLYSRLLSK